MESTTCGIQQIPQEVLTDIFKYLPVAPERWYCLFVCKAFCNAMQSHLWTHVSLQDSSVIDKTLAPLWLDPWRLSEEEKQRANDLKPTKRINFLSVHFISYLRRCHREHVVELDLSYVHLSNQEEFLSKECNITLEQESTFWNLMFDFPNLEKLSLFATIFGDDDDYYRADRPNPLKIPQRMADCRSSVRNLNLLFSTLTQRMRIQEISELFRHAPNLEIFQMEAENIMPENGESDSVIKSDTLKQLYFFGNNMFMDSLLPHFPNLELAMRDTYSADWLRKNGKLTMIEPIELQNTRERDLKLLSTIDTKFITRMQTHGAPILFTLLWVWVKVAQLRVLMKYIPFDLNAKVRGLSDKYYDPFVVPYANVSSFYGRLLPTEGETALHYAVKLGKLDIIEFLLQQGADPNTHDSLLRTPLFYSHDVQTTQLLVEYRADPKLLDKNGWNILMSYIAIKKTAHGDFAEDYENAQAFFVFEDSYDDHAFKDIEAYTALGLDLSYRANDGLNIFKIALMSGNFFLAKHLLKVTDDAIKETSPCVGSLSCVVMAKNVTVTEQLEMMNILLDGGADPMMVDDAGQSFFHLAALRNNFDILIAAMNKLENFVDVIKLKDNAGYSCVHYSESCDNWDLNDQQQGRIQKVQKTLKKYEVSSSTRTLDDFLQRVAENDCINLQSTSGETPLLLWCRFTFSVKRFSSVKKLLDHGANPNISDLEGVSPLITAAYEVDFELAELLLESGANINHCDNKGINAVIAATLRFLKRAEIPIMQASNDLWKENFERVLTLLLENNADVNQHEKLCGFTALHLLVMCKEDSEIISTCIKKLVARGADVNARTHMNETPLHRAIMYGNTTAVKTLLELGANINARGICLMTPLHYVLKFLDPSETDRPSATVATRDGFKAVGTALVRYPAWIWSSIDDFSQSTERSVEYFEQKFLVIFAELFKFADRIDFDAKNLDGEIPLYKAMILSSTAAVTYLKNFQQIYVPLRMLEYASKEQLFAKNICGTTPVDSFFNIMRNAKYLSAGAKDNIKIVAKKCFELAGDALSSDYLLLAYQAGIDITQYNSKGTNLLLRSMPELPMDCTEPPIFTLFSKPMTKFEHFKRCLSLIDPSIWKYQEETRKETILHRILSWWRNASCEAMLFNHVHPSLMESDLIVLEVLERSDPNAKNIVGYSFVDILPQYEKIRANLPLLRGEEKRAIQKPDYFSDPAKQSQLDRLIALTHAKHN